MAVATSGYCIRRFTFAQMQGVWEFYAFITADSYALDHYQ